MPRASLLVNCARGGLVDLDALEADIRSERIAGAAIDAFPLKPPAPPPLLTAWAKDEDWIRGRLCLHHPAPVLVQPGDARRHPARDAATTVAEHLATGTLRNAVNRNLLV